MGLRLPSLSFDSSISKENTNGRVSGVLHSSSLGRLSMVSNAHVTSGSSSNIPASGQGYLRFQTVSQFLHPILGIFLLHVWLLCTGLCKRQAFLDQLSDESIHQKDLPPTISMIIGGNLSWNGVSYKRWIPSMICPSVNQFGEFLIFIHDKNFSPSTVKEYRSAISTTLKQISKVDFAKESVLSNLVRSFELERPRTKPHFPKWDLALVLTVLVSPPFEPLESCDFKELTLNTVFFLALALGRRCRKFMSCPILKFVFFEDSVSLDMFTGFWQRTNSSRFLALPLLFHL